MRPHHLGEEPAARVGPGRDRAVLVDIARRLIKGVPGEAPRRAVREPHLGDAAERIERRLRAVTERIDDRREPPLLVMDVARGVPHPVGRRDEISRLVPLEHPPVTGGVPHLDEVSSAVVGVAELLPEGILDLGDPAPRIIGPLPEAADRIGDRYQAVLSVIREEGHGSRRRGHSAAVPAFVVLVARRRATRRDLPRVARLVVVLGALGVPHRRAHLLDLTRDVPEVGRDLALAVGDQRAPRRGEELELRQSEAVLRAGLDAAALVVVLELEEEPTDGELARHPALLVIAVA